MLEAKQSPCVDIIANNEAILHLKQAIAGGKHWYIALLEAIGLWGSAEEIYNGVHYRYLIDNEAFDWLLLSERLCLEVDGLLPEEEREALLFFGKPPIELSKEKIKSLIGSIKYHAYLNYFYGVMIEEALILAVEEEVRKEKGSFNLSSADYIQEEAYRRVYGADMTELLRQFRSEKGYPQRSSISLAEQKEFTYWLFKYRLNQSEKAKVASDTKKALEFLQQNQRLRLINKEAGGR